jgi:hypothetical protein
MVFLILTKVHLWYSKFLPPALNLTIIHWSSVVFKFLIPKFHDYSSQLFHDFVTFAIIWYFLGILQKLNEERSASVWSRTKQIFVKVYIRFKKYTRGTDKFLARPTSLCILFVSEKISFDVSLVIFINSTNIPPIMIINSIYENQNLLSL